MTQYSLPAFLDFITLYLLGRAISKVLVNKRFNICVATSIGSEKPTNPYGLDCIDALVSGAGDIDLGAQADGRLEQAPSQICFDVLLDLVSKMGEVHAGLAKVDLLPNVDLLVDVLLVGVKGVGVFLVLVQGPRGFATQLVHGNVVCLCHMPHDAMHGFRLGEGLFLARCILWIHSPLGQVHVALLLVNSEHHANLCPAHSQQLGDRADSPLRQLAQQHHALTRHMSNALVWEGGLQLMLKHVPLGTNHGANRNHYITPS